MALRPNPWLALAAVVIVADQVTKYWATASLVYGFPEAVFYGFNLTLLHNTGAAFSFLSEQGGWQRWLFSAIAVVISMVVLVWMHRLERGQRWAPLALALILGGALGNLVDRVRFGYVVDFIQIYYEAWSWPAFNIADAAITCGAVMLILRGPGRAADEAADSARPQA